MKLKMGQRVCLSSFKKVQESMERTIKYRFTCSILTAIFAGVLFLAFGTEGRASDAANVKKYDAEDLEIVPEFSYHYAREAKKLMKVYEEAGQADSSEFVAVIYERKGLFDGSMQYVQTLSDGDYLYYGKMKNGKPNGKGIIIEDVDAMNCKLPVILGNFKDGQLDGYAVKFETMYTFAVKSEGYYKKGELNGEYIEYSVPVSNLEYIETLESYIRDKRYSSEEPDNPLLLEVPLMPVVVLETGGYKNGKMVGEWVVYFSDGSIGAEIKMNRDGETGKGSIYYPDGTLKYKGELKNFQYHGKGTLYKEDGSLEYKGKFVNGEIKS